MPSDVAVLRERLAALVGGDNLTAKMVLDEPLLARWVDPISDWSWLFIAAMVVLVVLAGLLMRRERIAAPREKAHSA